jgi:RimJ/RimL family protein N-acetyltransferase
VGAELAALTADDLPEVMRIERTPGYEQVVGSWTREEHEAELASPDARYLGFRDGDGLAGFVILQKFREPAIRLRRIAVGEVERGTGTRLVRAVLRWVFETTPAEAVTLGVATINDRAHHVYLREGFVDDYADADGTHMNMIVTRERWAAVHNSG